MKSMKSMKRRFRCSLRTSTAVMGALLACAIWAPQARAFDQYSVDRNTGNCADCHGNYRTTNYIPNAAARQGIVWPAGLHDSHRTTSGFLNGNCNACHSGAARFPVLLGTSAAAAPFNQACSGCHDGPGLRNHHELLVQPGLCSDCHGTEPIGNEKTPLPPVYTAPLGTTSGTTRINNPCNDGAAGTVFEGSFFDVLTVGLDNDGDTLYDQNDPDCITLLPSPTPTGTPVPPTETPVPPTETPVPPTETPVPPTETPVPPTPTPIPTNTPAKVSICHVPGGNVSKAKLITVDSGAARAHLRHGDFFPTDGSCRGVDEDREDREDRKLRPD